MKADVIVIAAVWVTLISTATSAETTGNSASCELHVWPTDKYAVTENLGGANGGLVGALVDEATRLKSPGDVRQQLETQLSPDDQARIIREMQLAHLYAIPRYAVAVESAEQQPVWTAQQLSDPSRLSASAPTCYAELAIISHQYLKQAIGTRLRTGIRYREYDPSGRVIVSVQDTTATKAKDFPAKKAEDVAASTASLQQAFRDNLVKFGKDKLKR